MSSFSCQARPALGVAAAQGMAKQFRVQLFQSDEASWRLYGTFLHQESAEQCLRSLEAQGYQARIIKYTLPAAA